MAKYKIPLIALAVFSISILLVNDNIEFASAALTSTDIATNFPSSPTPNTITYWWASQSLYAVIPSGASGQTSQQINFFQSGTLTPQSTLQSHIIEPVIGSFVDNPNVCAGGCPEADDDFWTGGTQSLWCGVTDCFTYWISSNSSYPHQLQRITMLDSDTIRTTGYMNITFANTPHPALWGRDTTGVGIGGITIFRAEDNAADANDTDLIVTGGTLIIGNSFRDTQWIDNFNNGATTVKGISGCYDCGGTGVNSVFYGIAGVFNSGSGITGRIFNPSSLSTLCTVATSAGFLASGAGGGGQVIYSSTLNKFGLVGEIDTTPDGADAIFWYNYNACTSPTADFQVSSVELGTINYLRSIAVDDIGEAFYAYHGSGQDTGTITKFNLSDPDLAVDVSTGVTTLPSITITGTVAQSEQSLAIDVTHQTLLVAHKTSLLRYYYLDNFSEQDNTADPACIEVVTGGQQICYEDTDGNGVPNFPNGSLDTLRPPTQNITNIGASLTCAIGFNDAACENDNPKENGVGLLLLLILVVVSYSFLVSIHIGATKVLNRQNVAVMDYLNINPVLLLVMLIIDVGAAKYMNWIPDVIFYTVVVVMGGLAAWGYFSALKGKGSSA